MGWLRAPLAWRVRQGRSNVFRRKAMTIRVGINGFGRMGRLALRASWGWPELDFAHINETRGGPEAAAHLLKFDSIHGRWAPDVAAGANAVTVDGRCLSFSALPTPGQVPWDT